VNKISGQVAYAVMSFGGFLSNRRKFSSVVMMVVDSAHPRAIKRWPRLKVPNQKQAAPAFRITIDRYKILRNLPKQSACPRGFPRKEFRIR
jgi:hypothetical protein